MNKIIFFLFFFSVLFCCWVRLTKHRNISVAAFSSLFNFLFAADFIQPLMLCNGKCNFFFWFFTFYPVLTNVPHLVHQFVWYFFFLFWVSKTSGFYTLNALNRILCDVRSQNDMVCRIFCSDEWFVCLLHFNA